MNRNRETGHDASAGGPSGRYSKGPPLPRWSRPYPKFHTTMIITQDYELRILPERRIVSEKIKGHWREEDARRYVAEVRTLTASFITDDWAMLTDLSEWKTSKHEIVEIIGEQLKWQMSNKMRANANFIPGLIERMQFSRMIQEAGAEFVQICSVHSTLAEADQHLQTRGF
jgi:hypothetical protein